MLILKKWYVEEILKRFNYTTDPVARVLALKSKEMRIVAVLPCWTDFFEVEVMRGIDSAKTQLTNYNLDIVVSSCETTAPRECAERLDDLLAQGICGISIFSK